MKLRFIPLCFVTVMLASCGGGGGGSGGNNPPPPPVNSQPSEQDINQAGAAKLTAAVDDSTDVLTLSWADTVAGASSYTVQQQISGGTWTTLATVMGQQGSGATLSWAGPASAAGTSDVYRVQAVFSGYTLPLSTQALQQAITVVVPVGTPTIAFDQAEPVTGLVTVSIANGGSYAAVNYYLDLSAVGSSTTGPAYAVQIGSGGPGSHLVLARLKTGTDSFLELRRTLQVAAPGYRVAMASEDQGDLVIKAYTSGGTTTSITAFVDGVSVGTLTATNYVGTVGPSYIWRVPSTNYASGPHTVRVDATNDAGVTATASATVIVVNYPVLTLTSPFDGMIVNGVLQVRGTATSDRSGPLSVAATLGSVTVLSTSTSPFSADFSLAGLPPGEYGFAITVTDSGGYKDTRVMRVNVTTATAYAPLRPLGGDLGGELLAVDANTRALIESPSETLRLVTGAGETVLDTTESYWESFTGFRLENGHVLAIGQLQSSNSGDFHLLRWAPDGTRHVVGTLTPASGSAPRLIAAHWPYALVSEFTNGNDTLHFFDVLTGQRITPNLVSVSGSRIIGKLQHDFYVAQDGSLVLYYLQAVPAAPVSGVGIARWTQSDDQNVAISSNASLESTHIMTDGERVTWLSKPVASYDPWTLLSLDIPTSGQQTLATNVASSELAHGLLAWSENLAAANYRLKVSDGTTVTTLSALSISQVHGVGDGYMLFTEDRKLYAADAAGTRRLVLDSIVDNPRIAGKTVYFTLGEAKTIYAVTLP